MKGPLIILLAPGCGCLGAADSLEDGFDRPPEQTKPWCYWYWISDNVSKEGITRDLEAMVRVNGQVAGTVGINRLIGDASLPSGQRHTYLRQQRVGGNWPLQPAGLFGPVTLSETRQIKINQP